jgi:hypothetical protein
MWQSGILMALVGFVKAERLVCEQLLAHGKNGRRKGEAGRWISLFWVCGALSLTQ